MQTRPLLETPAAEKAVAKMQAFHSETISQVKSAIASTDVVVVGMAQNPHVKRVRKTLEAAGVPFEYLEYGSYFSEWKRRLAIKMWSGWPTFPQVFVKGVLVGGADQIQEAIDDGSLKTRLQG